MKVTITGDGCMVVRSENDLEEYALKQWAKAAEESGSGGYYLVESDYHKRVINSKEQTNDK